MFVKYSRNDMKLNVLPLRFIHSQASIIHRTTYTCIAREKRFNQEPPNFIPRKSYINMVVIVLSGYILCSEDWLGVYHYIFGS